MTFCGVARAFTRSSVTRIVHSSGHASRCRATAYDRAGAATKFRARPWHAPSPDSARATGTRPCDPKRAHRGKWALSFGHDSRLEHDVSVPHGKTAVAVGGNILSDDEITARAELGRNGVALVTLLLDASGKLVFPPRVSTRGVPLNDERTMTLRSVAAHVVRTVDEARRHGFDMEEDVRRVDAGHSRSHWLPSRG